MSEPPDQGGEWRPIADQIAANVKNFIDGVEALAQRGGDETVPMLIRLSSVTVALASIRCGVIPAAPSCAESAIAKQAA